jgi:hypothetical protein
MRGFLVQRFFIHPDNFLEHDELQDFTEAMFPQNLDNLPVAREQMGKAHGTFDFFQHFQTLARLPRVRNAPKNKLRLENAPDWAKFIYDHLEY